MTLVVGIIGAEGQVIVGADTSEKIDVTPGDTSECLKKVEFWRRSKVCRISDRGCLAFWGETTRVNRMVETIRRRASSGDAFVIAEVAASALEEDIRACVNEGAQPDEIGFMIGGYTDQNTASLYRVEVITDSTSTVGQRYSVQRYFFKPIPGRLRLVYGGDYSLARSKVQLIGDLVEQGIAAIDALPHRIVAYLIESTASYILSTTGLPLVGGDVEIMAYDTVGNEPQYTKSPITTRPVISLPGGVSSIIRVPM